MKKTLIVVAHPDLSSSVVNRSWVEALQQYPQQFTVHDLYARYPDWQIDVVAEQKLLEEHDAVVLQFPFYWFSSPPLLKKWLDDVFLYGWAYGSTGDKLKNKRVGLAISAGISEQDYSGAGRYQFTLEQLLYPFQLTLNYVKADYRAFHAFYDAENMDKEALLTAAKEDGPEYLRFLKKMAE
ncbi:MAG: NAD(P)H-dependent oxidoreductase [Enterobacteriaceae bacterium]